MSGLVSADIVDCTAFISSTASDGSLARSQISAAGVRGALTAATTSGGAAAASVTVVELRLERGANLKLRCTAMVAGAAAKKRFQPAQSAGANTRPLRGGTAVSTTTAGGFAYVDGVATRQLDGSPAFSAIRESLVAAGTRMNLMLNCLFFVASEAGIDPLFGGFDKAFNKAAPPPPTRTEFVGLSPGYQCLDAAADGGRCEVLAKCVAAMPAAPGE